MSDGRKPTMQSPVSFRIFAWAMGFVFLMYGVMATNVSALSSKVDGYLQKMTNVEVQLSQIQTDLQWIKDNLNVNR